MPVMSQYTKLRQNSMIETIGFPVVCIIMSRAAGKGE
jgi:hypothetical protein